MRETMLARLRERFAMYDALLEDADDELLGVKLDVTQHKSLIEHLWCVVGARESYAKALAVGEWGGFACSMQSYTTEDFRRALADSASAVLAACAGVDEWTPVREELFAALCEHEVMHEGGIIRHMYGLGRSMPEASAWA